MKTSIPKLSSVKWKNGQLAENVVTLRHDKDIPVINVLQGAFEELLSSICIIGYDKNGKEYVATSYSSPQDAAYLFARGQLFMLRQSDN